MKPYLFYPVNVTNPRTGKVDTFQPQPVADLPKHAQAVLAEHPDYLGEPPVNTEA